MAIGSRLRQRRKQHAVNIVKQTRTSGQYADSNIYTGLKATKDSKSLTKTTSDGGIIPVVMDVFWFDYIDGASPSIEPEYIIVDGSSRHEIEGIIPHDYIKRLEVILRKIS